jgi:hypothetical protein
MTLDELIARTQEIRGLGCAYAENGLEAPADLCAEYERLEAEIQRRVASASPR